MSDLPDLVDIDSAPTGHTAEQVAQQFEDDDANDDASDEEAESECRCLLCASVLPSAVAAFEHCARDHAFDFLQLRKQHKLDFYASMSALNLLRAQPADSTVAQRIAVFSQAVAAYGAQDVSGPLSNGKYMQPADSDDPILFSFDDDSDDEDNQTNSNAIVPVAQYEAEIHALRAQIAQMTEVMHRVALSGPAPVADSGSDSDEEVKKSNQAESNSFASPSAPGKKRDQGYFDGYSDMGIHEEMLRDTVRTLAYRDFMYNNRALFKDRVVLDIGCGTSILSLFAAEAGARRVIGIDRAAVVDRAAEIVKANGKAGIVTLVKGRVEELTSLPESKVDIIISEWMGYLLLYESMLSTVLYARDKWLAPGGVVHPSRARVLCAGLDTERWRAPQREFWRNVYGFDFSSMLQPWPRAVVGDEKEPVVEVVDGDAICTDEACLRDIDIMTVTDAALDFTSPFSIVASRACTFGALCIYFDTSFEAGCVQPHVVLDTSPHAPPTHWKQTMLFLREGRQLQAGDRVTGTVQLQRPHAHPRGYDIVLTIRFGNGETDTIQMYEMR